MSREKASGETMSAGDIFKVETVFIADPLEGGAGNVPQPKITNQVSPHLRSCTMSRGSSATVMNGRVNVVICVLGQHKCNK